MLTIDELERNRALRIAYNHARRGSHWLADRWMEWAVEFTEPSDRQLEHFQMLMTTNPAISPDQLSLDELLAPTEEEQAA